MRRGRPSTKHKLGDVFDLSQVKDVCSRNLDFLVPSIDIQSHTPSLNDHFDDYNAGLDVLDQQPEDGVQAKRKKFMRSP
jgi:hypothetical protein